MTWKPGMPRNGALEINEMCVIAHGNSKDHGFWEGEEDPGELPIKTTERIVALKIALIHSEASEALEEARDDGLIGDLNADRRDAKGKPIGIAAELADIVIRVGDLAGWLGIDLELAIERKHAHNVSRPRKHGKAF
jgi:NTP pyrophosphatase (non-canonical NTP hydrolase)